MKITDIEVFPLQLPMKQSFAISSGSVGDKNIGAPHVYVKITSESGYEGWGESRPSHRWSYETLETVVTTINQYITPVLIGEKADNLQVIHQKMNQQIAAGASIGQPIAKAAIDIALHDLIGKQEGKRLAGLWMGTFSPALELSYLISTTDLDTAKAKAQYAREHGYHGVDVKIGFDVNQDMKIVESIKEEVPDLFFRVDANQGYSLSDAVQAAIQMEKIGVDVFEQPLPANDLLGHAELRRKTSLPIALDESIWTPSDLMQAIRLEACDVAVIKLTKMGGLTGARQCGEIARHANIGLLGGGLTESTLGLTASGHLFNYLGIETPVDLNGPFFLADDPVTDGPAINEGRVTLPEGHGIGCTIDVSKIDQYLKTV